MLRWEWQRLQEMAPAQLYAVFAARSAVFVVEQGCAYQDLDGFDAQAMHLTGWAGQEVAAYLRAFGPGVRYREASLGRVITTTAFRSQGLGRALMATGLEHMAQTFPGHPIRISAQARLERFYASFGFMPQGETYLEDGIPHLSMVRV